ncbi:MAG: hypothetical protein WC376_05250 [Candidatus Nanoarchaeia archaeon]|jgi:hypothetical protein
MNKESPREKLEIIILTDTLEDFELCNKKVTEMDYMKKEMLGKWTYNSYVKNYDFEGFKFTDTVSVHNPNYKCPLAQYEKRLFVKIGKDVSNIFNTNYLNFENLENFKEKFEEFKFNYLKSKIEVFENTFIFSMIEGSFIHNILGELMLKNPEQVNADINLIKDNYFSAKIYYKLKLFNQKSNKIIKGVELTPNGTPE